MTERRSDWPIYLIVHGHFYQPPRENPWIGRVERQESAAPAHDWNERVTTECYRANCYSRRLDGFGRIVEVVNNFAYLSFNVGATLFAYLERFQPDVARRVVQADVTSRRLFGGHGSAMAQVYNHVIMPLADPRDQLTQILWGLADFEHRFGRPAEGMWLAECAINDAVVDLLIANGVRYTILSPHQAQRVRPLAPPKTKEAAPARKGRARPAGDEAAEAPWHDVSQGQLDPSRAYRVVRPKGHLDVLFFDAGLSRGVSFDGLLRDASALADRAQASAPDRPEPVLVHVATDGETFGHHHPFGDMCIAALVREAAASRGLTLTNPSQFLERCPAAWEVQLKEGDRGLGTAWSCSHGVGRWMRDCGCSAGAQQGWNQKWRAPLLEGLNHLKEELRRVFVRVAGAWLKDPWVARDDYVSVVLAGHAPRAQEAFLERHLAREAPPEVRADLVGLFEAQRYAMYMFTSCGWFFADISGIETVQNLKFAARAIELTAPHSPLNFEEILLCHLARAQSNVERWRNGDVVWKEAVRPYAGLDRQIAFNALLEEVFLRDKPCRRRFMAEVSLEAHRRELVAGRESPLAIEDDGRQFTWAECGSLVLANRVSGHRRTFDYLLLRGPSLELEGYVALGDPARPERTDPAGLATILRGATRLRDAHRAVVSLFRVEPFGYQHVFYDLREELAGWASRDVRDELGARSEEALVRHGNLARSLLGMGLPLPHDLKRALDGAFEIRVSRWIAGASPSVGLTGLGAILEEAARLGAPVDRRPLTAYLSDVASASVRSLGDLIRAGEPAAVEERVKEITHLLDEAKRLDVPLARQVPEEELDTIVVGGVEPMALELEDPARDKAAYRICSAVLDLALRLNFSPDRRARLMGRYEKTLANDPALWP